MNIFTHVKNLIINPAKISSIEERTLATGELSYKVYLTTTGLIGKDGITIPPLYIDSAQFNEMDLSDFVKVTVPKYNYEDKLGIPTYIPKGRILAIENFEDNDPRYPTGIYLDNPVEFQVITESFDSIIF